MLSKISEIQTLLKYPKGGGGQANLGNFPVFLVTPPLKKAPVWVVVVCKPFLVLSLEQKFSASPRSNSYAYIGSALLILWEIFQEHKFSESPQIQVT